MLTVGEFIERKRREKDISLTDLGKLCNMSQSTLSRVKNNSRDIEFNELQELSRQLNFNMEEFEQETGLKILGITKNNELKSSSPPEPPPDSNIKEIIQETARATSEETINRIREKYRTPLFLQQYNELNELVKKGRQMEAQEKEDLPPGAIRMKVSEFTLPMVKNIRAGELGTEVEMEDEPVSIPGSWKNKGDFCVKVKGNSMRQEGILDGMICLVRKQPSVENGNIALVYKYSSGEINGILKKIKYLPDGKILLFNGNNENFEIGEEFEIIGKVIAWYKMP
jgi:SOS-response transcriptional repressor LexA